MLKWGEGMKRKIFLIIKVSENSGCLVSEVLLLLKYFLVEGLEIICREKARDFVGGDRD